jgi:hypothetical protein
MSPNVLSLHGEGDDINIQDVGVSREIPEGNFDKCDGSQIILPVEFAFYHVEHYHWCGLGARDVRTGADEMETLFFSHGRPSDENVTE